MTGTTCRILSAALLTALFTLPSTAFGEDSAVYCREAPRRWSHAWYQQAAMRPPGTRQECHYGKLWPPYSRPVDEHLEFSHAFHHNHYWPHPYNCQDRHYTRAILDRQAGNGWVDATTLYDYHFDEETNKLTTAGQLHLRYILTETPSRYRQAFVQTGAAPEASQTRMASVRSTAAAIVGDANVPPILQRMTTAYGRPALEIVTIRRLDLATQPAPRIPIPSSSSASAGPAVE